MIRFSSIFITAIVVFASCKNGNETNNTTTAAPYDYAKLEGSYRGDFGGSGDIVVTLRHVTEKNAVGFDLHKGLRRNISGDIFPADKGFKFVMHEPGDNQFDGIFEFIVDTSNNEITGSWKPANNKSLTAKTLALKKYSGGNDGKTANDYSVFADSIGELNFKEGGLCIYRYYPKDAAGKTAEQFLEIKGNWKTAGGSYIVDWQKNEVFANKQSVFKPLNENGEDYSNCIEGDGRRFYTPEF